MDWVKFEVVLLAGAAFCLSYLIAIGHREYVEAVNFDGHIGCLVSSLNQYLGV